MKQLTLFTGLLALAVNTALAADAPRGSLLELHSCELFAGGCTVSAEVPQDGRYMLRVWEFAAGNFNGTDFKGLQLAVLQASPDNLAATDSKTGNAVVYLPESATQSQRDALVAWVKSSQTDFKPAKLQTRTVPLQFSKGAKGYDFSAGQFISVKAAPLDSCDLGSCGEELWYQPRATSSLFTVAVNRSSQVNEPLLKLNWTDAAKRSVFLARFGEPNARQVYVTMDELCGPTKSLF
jgi:uncharacterized protein DUF1326